MIDATRDFLLNRNAQPWVGVTAAARHCLVDRLGFLRLGPHKLMNRTVDHQPRRNVLLKGAP
jgi:hypothetical protein